jgi:formate/nitrite transporter FocA (FNT family)
MSARWQGGSTPVTWLHILGNLLPVIAGNLVGGSVLVGLAYHVIYRRGAPIGAKPNPATPPARMPEK